jgi:hypothetical protein
LHNLKDIVLDQDDWSAIEVVKGWLSLFRTATTHMSSRDKTTISSVFAVFLALQNDVRQSLKAATSGISLELKTGLIEAHEKLAEYFRKSDASPFYMWAACKSGQLLADTCWLISMFIAVLDPRVTYHGALEAAGSEWDLRQDIMTSKRNFERHFLEHYTEPIFSAPRTASTSASSSTTSIFSLFTRGRDQTSEPLAELERFFALSAEPYETCADPVQWWGSHRSLFPRLSRMARDILAIPGMSSHHSP